MISVEKVTILAARAMDPLDGKQLVTQIFFFELGCIFVNSPILIIRHLTSGIGQEVPITPVESDQTCGVGGCARTHIKPQKWGTR
jgi:hypothetical protein